MPLYYSRGLIAADGSVLTAPTADGTSGQVMQTNGSGQLSFGDKGSISKTTANTTTVTDMLTLAQQSSGVVDVVTGGFGSGIRFQLEDEAGAIQNTGRIIHRWENSPTGLRRSEFVVKGFYSNAETDLFTIKTSPSTGLPAILNFPTGGLITGVSDMTATRFIAGSSGVEFPNNAVRIRRLGNQLSIESYDGWQFFDTFSGLTRIQFYRDGRVRLAALPTANPISAGMLWNDGGTLKISAG